MSDTFEHESLQDSQSISKYLKALIEGFEKGKISFKSEADHIVFYPNNLLQLDIKARKKDEKNKITIKIVWKDSMKTKDGSITIN